MGWKQIKQKLDELDVQKIAPGYFNKTIFRAAFFAVFLIVITGMAQSIYYNGFTISLIEYSCNDERGCFNPYYECKYHPGGVGDICPDDMSYYCDLGMCEKEQLEYKDTIGHKVPHLVKYGLTYLFLLLLLAFIVNHIEYRYFRK